LVQEFILVKIYHDFASFDLLKSHLDVFAQRFELDAIKRVLIMERSERLG